MAFSANPDRQLRSPFYSKLNLHHHVDTNVTSQISPPHCAVHKRVMDPFRMCFSVVWKHHDDSLRFSEGLRSQQLSVSPPGCSRVDHMAFSANPDQQLCSPLYSKLNLLRHSGTNVTSFEGVSVGARSS
nr:hypothetical transcript [Hymenolepis microstoma]